MRRLVLATELELLDNVADLLESMDVGVRAAVRVRDGEEGGLLEQHDLVGLADAAELCELRLETLDVRDQRVDDRRPRQVQRLVPDRGAEAGDTHRSGGLAQLGLFAVKDLRRRVRDETRHARTHA